MEPESGRSDISRRVKLKTALRGVHIVVSHNLARSYLNPFSACRDELDEIFTAGDIKAIERSVIRHSFAIVISGFRLLTIAIWLAVQISLSSIFLVISTMGYLRLPGYSYIGMLFVFVMSAWCFYEYFRYGFKIRRIPRRFVPDRLTTIAYFVTAIAVTGSTAAGFLMTIPSGRPAVQCIGNIASMLALTAVSIAISVLMSSCVLIFAIRFIPHFNEKLMLGMLPALNVLLKCDDLGVSVRERRSLVRDLEALAKHIEIRLPKMLGVTGEGDPNYAVFRKKAAYVRDLKPWILFSKSDTEKYLKREMAVIVGALGCGRLDHLKLSDNVHGGKIGWRQRILLFLRQLVAAVIPGGLLAALNVAHVTLPDELRVAWSVASVVWAAAFLLTVLDPKLNERVVGAKNLLDMLRGR
ncbi:hypothetical protein ACW2Q0_30760 [Nocardia sp. R16R-3T]